MLAGDQLRSSEDELYAALQNIEKFYASSRAGNHTGEPGCDRCMKKKRRIKQAYYDYYLGHERGRWDYHLSAYREEMQRMFDDSEAYSLEDIHGRYQRELREHLKRDLCTVTRGDSKDIVDHKAWTSSRFDSGEDTKPILETHFEGALNCMSLEAADAIHAIQKTTTPEERISIYVKYYCTPAWTDTPQQKNMKAKYARQFEAGHSHDEVLTSWKKEVLYLQQEEISKLKHRLGELQMAQSAHLKNKAKKAERDQRMQDREYVFVPKLEMCSLESCGMEVDVGTDGGAIQCAVCDWLARRSDRRRRYFYCSEDHAEEDFVEHDRTEHVCIMGNQCIYYPEPGPEGDTGAGGVCPDCMDEGYSTYFCSQVCYETNLEVHRETFHNERGISHTSNQLDIFHPEGDLEITAS
ncbi:hypothetical protein OIDMADRAFT_191412 [Oidiodendron maius Zn]|uniref:Uncharacterized protein n=1 Tax=Oidiodendron maius (strain Zn) TaxID=913774 RepID=A0A0C3H861_OIDMZ|nr:hypothetical protein OIDMADRAFT_191412 [Oidiodendron maius Zn]